MPVLDSAATLLQCTEALGWAQKCLEMVVYYASNRVQFGRPIGTFQTFQPPLHRLASLLVEAQFMETIAVDVSGPIGLPRH